jgi:hypothetical protein
LFDGVSRLVAPRDYHLGNNDSGVDGLSSINRLTFSIDRESLNPNDNKYIVENNRIWIINVLSFLTAFGYEKNDYYEYDLREPASKIIRPDTNRTNKKVITTEDWKDITYKPTLEQQRQIAEQRVGQQLQRQRQQQQQQQQQQRQQQRQQQQQQYFRPQPPPNINIFSPEYARYIGAKSRATTSAHIRLGGVRR